MIKCIGCKKEKDNSLYYLHKRKDKSRYSTRCKDCSKEKSKQYYHKNKSKCSLSNKVWREKNKTYVKAYKRKHINKLKISINEVIELEKTSNSCAICQTKSTDLVLDHCHNTNEYRGFLCKKCNPGLGFFNDNPELLLKACIYLLNFSKKG